MPLDDPPTETPPRPRATKPARAASKPATSSCGWCGTAGEGMVKGKGASSRSLFHRECADAVELFCGWDEPIEPAT